MYTISDLGEVLLTIGKFLLFRRVAPDLARLGPLYLAAGLFFTWLAGIGRHWDNPGAAQWQHLGLASIAYVLLFALFLWLILWPLKPCNWTYENVLTFVALTAPPALLYALPGRFLPVADVPAAKMWLLGVVAAWRVALLVRYLSDSAGLKGGELFVAVCLPLAFLITAAAFLEDAQYSGSRPPLIPTGEEMIGHRTTAPEPFPPEWAFFIILTIIAFLGVLAVPCLMIAYLVICVSQWRR